MTIANPLPELRLLGILNGNAIRLWPQSMSARGSALYGDKASTWGLHFQEQILADLWTIGQIRWMSQI